MRLHVERIKREDTVIATLEKDVTDFLNELREIVRRLKTKYDPEPFDVPEIGRTLMAG